MIRSTGVPLAIAWPCARCVDAITSSRASAAQTPVAVASWPIATCRNPGSSPARKRSSTLLLEPADEQHLAEEPAQDVLGYVDCPRTRLALRRSSSSGHYADPPMRAAEQWAQIEEGLDPDWGGGTAHVRRRRLGGRRRRGSRPAAAGTGRRRAAASRPARGRRCRACTQHLPAARRPTDLGHAGAHRASTDVVPGLRRRGHRPAEALRSPRTGTRLWRALPPDWSDILCMLELDSSDHLPRAALLGAPMNPTRVPGEIALQLSRVREAGVRRVAADGSAVLRAHGRRRHHGLDHESSTGSRTRRTPRRRARSGASRDARSSATIRAEPRMPWRACGSQRKRSVPVFASFTFHVCVPTYATASSRG